MPRILGMQPKTLYWVAGGGVAAVLLLLYLRSRRRTGDAQTQDTGLPATTGAPAAVDTSGEYAAALDALRNQMQQQQTAQAAASVGATTPEKVPTAQQAAAAAPGGMQSVLNPLTGEVTYVPADYDTSKPAPAGGYQKVQTSFSLGRPSCPPGQSWDDSVGACVMPAGEFRRQQAAQQPQQAADNHAAPAGTQCGPGEHWSYNQRRCRGNVNWFQSGVDLLTGNYGGAASSAAGNVGIGISTPAGTPGTPGIAPSGGASGGGGGGGGSSSQQYDQFGQPIVQSASVRQTVRPGTGRRPTLTSPTTHFERTY